MTIHFLLPAYNEEENLRKQVETLCRLADSTNQAYSLLIVNDGSSDATLSIAEDLARENNKVNVASHAKNQGPGKAFDTGFNAIFDFAKDEDCIISMDADNTHSENTIGMMLARLSEGYEMVIASVYAPGGMFIGVPFLRYVLSLGCNFIYRILFPIAGIKEYTGFYRAYRVGALKKAYQRFQQNNTPLITRPGFSCAAEILVKLRQIPVFMTEVPMLVRYDQKGGKSKMRITQTILEHLKIIGSNVFKRRII